MQFLYRNTRNDSSLLNFMGFFGLAGIVYAFSSMSSEKNRNMPFAFLFSSYIFIQMSADHYAFKRDIFNLSLRTPSD